MEDVELRCLEFFCGIGGLHLGFEKSGAKGEIVASFDVNVNGNLCYKHNFKKDPITTTLEYLKEEDIKKYKGNCWLMSPPCQPYTLGGSKRDDKDSRARPLLNLINLISQMSVQDLPLFIFIENVPGFEVSNSRQIIVDTLIPKKYEIFEFMLSPHQIGFPYERRRYFMAARKLDDHSEGKIHEMITEPFWIQKVNEVPQLKTYLDKFNSAQEEKEFLVPEEFITKPKNFRFDIVTPESKRCACITKAYGSKHIFGSGSFIQTENFSNEINFEDTSTLLPLGLRFFTPSEIARLHGFPIDEGRFTFPSELSRLQQYKLLGNSLNCSVVGHILDALIHRKL